MKRLFLGKFFAELWKDKEPFTEVCRIDGTLFREVKSRRTLRFECGGRAFFLKHHQGTGWREIWKNLLLGKRPVLGAGNEFRALQTLQKLSVPTMTPEAYGERGCNPANHESFLITAELPNAVSLEDLTQSWRETPPEFAFKLALLREVARTMRIMHDEAKINHRDCYICHFLLDEATKDDPRPVVSVIDLHRAEQRKNGVPFRYRVKDLAGLRFSSMDIALTQRDLFRFFKLYRGTALRKTLQEDERLWFAVECAARKLYQKEHRAGLSEQECCG